MYEAEMYFCSLFLISSHMYMVPSRQLGLASTNNLSKRLYIQNQVSKSDLNEKSQSYREICNKIQHPFMVRTLSKLELRNILEKPTTNILLNSEKLNILPTTLSTKQRCPSHHSFSTSQQKSCQCSKPKKENFKVYRLVKA